MTDKTNNTILRIGTRGSALALAQSQLVGQMLAVPFELVTFSTRGDRATGPLAEVGGKGLFTAELEAALRSGEVHLAVHSAKDMPAEMDAELVIGCVPEREDPRDVLVSPKGALADLPPSPRIGTSSFRRSVQLRLLRPDVQTLPLRGNVETRLRKLKEGQYDAIVLALAGLKRLALAGDLQANLHPLAIDDFIPAAGQAALALQCRAADEATLAVLAKINHADSAAALAAERIVVARLHASCHSALGVHIRRLGQLWHGDALAADVAGRRVIRARADAASAELVANDLHAQLARQGAEELLQVEQP